MLASNTDAMNHRFLLLLFLLGTSILSSQNEVLFTVDNEEVKSADFIRVYKKNLDLVKDDAQKDVDTYLNLFVNYKLKVKEAKALGFDKKQQYVSELGLYRKQLSKNYLTDAKASEELIKEAYDRIQYEINATHILIRVNQNAKPEDTLAVYNRLKKLRKRLKKNDFEALRKELHDGEQIFVEDLGYFSTFDMVYPFETAAYETNVGEVSMPVRTQFGFHILMVHDKRKSEGERTVAHIMVTGNKANTKTFNAEERIKDVYNKHLQGEAFDALAKRFSDDKGTSNRGGMLERLKRGKLSSKEFENIAFSLQNKNDVSEPFKTNFGWHIVKLLDIHPIGSFDEMQFALKDRVLKDSRSKIIGDSFYDDIKKRYDFKINEGATDYFASILNNDYFSRKWSLPTNSNLDKDLMVIGDKKFKYQEFGDYLVKRQEKGSPPIPFKKLVDLTLEEFARAELYRYHDNHLEEEFDEFRVIMQEYREGILLFNLMESQIWNKSKENEKSLQAFYESNKENYMWAKRIKGSIISSSDKKAANDVINALNSGKSLDEIKQVVNQASTRIIVTSGLFEASNSKLPKNFEFNKGVSKIYKDGDYYVIVHVDEILEASVKEFDNVKGKVINDYQQHLENSWIEELRSKYKVEINQEALNKVKKSLTK